MPKKEAVKRDPLEEIDLLDLSLNALVELLDERGLVKYQEWEKRIKQRLHPNR